MCYAGKITGKIINGLIWIFHPQGEESQQNQVNTRTGQGEFPLAMIWTADITLDIIMNLY